jgi:sortase A
MRRVEYLLFGLAFGMLGWCGWTLLESRLYQTLHENEFEQTVTRQAFAAAAPALPHPEAPALPHPEVPKGTALGRIEIPRIDVSAIIAEGDSAATLRLAVGHIPGTAFPGEAGNVGLAGHRDSFFRSLARIRLHDEIRVTAKSGVVSLYRVDSIAVVEPADVSVLEPSSRPSVTLVTCYPFHFIGAAPKRFVVKAGSVSF